MLLCDFISHCPCPGSCDGVLPFHSHGKASFPGVLPMGEGVLQLSITIQAIQPSPLMRLLRCAALQRLRSVTALLTCYVSVCLSASGKSSTQEEPRPRVNTSTGTATP